MIDELADYDAIVIGTPTRFGAMSSQMKNFLDQAGGLWMNDRLVGKVGSAFATTGSQHGGQEATILSIHTVMLHLGLVVVGLPYTFKGQSEIHEIAGGSPYGATALCRPGEREPSGNEIDGARFQGWHVAQVAAALRFGRAAIPAGAEAKA